MVNRLLLKATRHLNFTAAKLATAANLSTAKEVLAMATAAEADMVSVTDSAGKAVKGSRGDIPCQHGAARSDKLLDRMVKYLA